jgi:cytochrome P450
MGRQLALMETRVALKKLIGRNPDLQLAVDPSDLEIQPVAAWHRHASLPVRLG